MHVPLISMLHGNASSIQGAYASASCVKILPATFFSQSVFELLHKSRLVVVSVVYTGQGHPQILNLPAVQNSTVRT